MIGREVETDGCASPCWKRRKSDPISGASEPSAAATTTHMMVAEDGSDENSSIMPRGDCYDQILALYSSSSVDCDEGTVASSSYHDDARMLDCNDNNNSYTTATVHSSWLNQMEWITSCSSYHCHQNTAPDCNLQGTASAAAAAAAAAASTSSTEGHGDSVQHICHKLLQVKQRLGPASEAAALAAGTSGRFEFAKARRACNPLELLGESGRPYGHEGLNHQLFMNRSAIKLANIDALVGYLLTQRQLRRISQEQISSIVDDDAFVFVDLCGAPGGFSEYVLWRFREQDGAAGSCRGFGMSLVGTNEQGTGLCWKMDDSATCCHQHDNNYNKSYSRYRICYGADGTGDVYRWENVECLQQMIARDCNTTNGAGCISLPNLAHLVVVDGGFDSQRNVDNQEQVAQKLIVCETAAALSVLRDAGTLVIKMFGFQTDVIRAVMLHLYLSFDSMIALKPVSSRPASAERYVVCCGYLGNPGRFNGRQWCNEMFLGLNWAKSRGTVSIANEIEDRLFRYLNKFDYNLFNLNLKACFAMLSYLERRCMKYSKHYGNTLISCDDNDDDSTDEESFQVLNIASYRCAWQLF
jgi:cap1 methyltransferase